SRSAGLFAAGAGGTGRQLWSQLGACPCWRGEFVRQSRSVHPIRTHRCDLAGAVDSGPACTGPVAARCRHSSDNFAATLVRLSHYTKNVRFGCMEFAREFIVLFDRLQIRYYGIIIVVAMLIAATIAARLARRDGRDPDHIWGALTWAIIPAIIGARLWYVLSPPSSAVAQGMDTAWYFQN